MRAVFAAQDALARSELLGMSALRRQRQNDKGRVNDFDRRLLPRCESHRVQTPFAYLISLLLEVLVFDRSLSARARAALFGAALASIFIAFSSCTDRESAKELAPQVGERSLALLTVIDTCAELQAMENDLSGDYQLGSDVDCAGFDVGDGKGFRPVGVGGWVYTPFEGHFDGAGHVISNLTINRPLEDSVGLFGLAGAGVIERVGLENVSIVGYEAVGAVVGATEGTLVREVYATGSITGHLSGGVVGFLKHEGILRDSYSRLTVDWNWQGGLLCDYLYYDAHVERSYAVGTGDEGRLYGDIGEGGDVIDSFFDCTVAGDCGNEGGETTTNLKSQTFLTGQGWDFTNTWAISSVDGYPCLRWQAGCGTPPDAGVDGGTDAGLDACSATGPDTDCDGVDDDCDGVADDGYVPQSTACGIGACVRSGVTSCSNGTVQDSCIPGTAGSGDATCNGLDDDCDGTADEDFVSQSSTCGAGACAASGVTSCLSGNVVDSCTPGTPGATDDTCNGVDEDCSGIADDDYQTGTTSCVVDGCQATGTRTCVDGNVVDDCMTSPQCVAEVACNDGVDNDNDGDTDCADANCAGSGCSPTEICNNTIDDDLDGAQDCADSDCDSDPACTVVPPDPATVAPPVITPGPYFAFESTRFLFEGSNPIQRAVAPGTIVAERTAVLRGLVTNVQGAPLVGVRVDVLGHPELGHTLTRADGRYDLAVNGGDRVTLQYTAHGYLNVQRSALLTWGDTVTVPAVALTLLDPIVTEVDTSGSAIGMQFAVGSTSTDSDGTRAAIVMFPAGTSATMTLANGSVQTLPSIAVRATEYTVGARGLAAMPAEPACNTAYTYAVELSVDEAIQAGATKVTFSADVPLYVDNFLGFAVGSAVPTGFYDREQAQWLPVKDGRVIRIVSIAPTGEAEIDVSGDDLIDGPAELTPMGITDEELVRLAQLRPAGATLWRVMLDHFTPLDCNWPYRPRSDIEGPDLPDSPPPHPPTPPPTPPPPPPLHRRHRRRRHHHHCPHRHHRRRSLRTLHRTKRRETIATMMSIRPFTA
jgi:hypothetical protein